MNEIGYVIKNSYDNQDLKIGQELISVNPKCFRPTEVELLIGDPTKAKTILGREPIYDFESMVAGMVLSDLGIFKQNQLLKSAGFVIKNEFE